MQIIQMLHQNEPSNTNSVLSVSWNILIFLKFASTVVPYVKVKCKITQAPLYAGHIGEGRAHAVL